MSEVRSLCVPEESWLTELTQEGLWEDSTDERQEEMKWGETLELERCWPSSEKQGASY